MPYDPLAQAELEQQRAEQNSASPNASPEDQQEAAERAVRKQQAYESSPSHQASLANAATREAEKAQRTAQEAAYRSQGIPTWTGADGNLYPDTHKLSEQAAKEQEKTAKEQAKAAKDATDLAARQQRADAIRSGRRHQVNPVDKTPIYLESEEQLQARRAAEAEKLRRSHIEEQIRATEAEHGALFAQHAAEGIKPLPATARKALTEKGLTKAKQDALYALQSQYQEQAKATDKGGWWDVVNNNPTPEATAAQQHLARLSAPDAELTEEDLALLAQNDATKPIVQKIQNIQGRLSKDDELQKLKADHDLRVAELKLRRDAPDKWAESVRARRAQMTPEQLQAELETSNADLDTRAASLQQKATALNEQIAAHTQQLEALSQQAAQRREQGIPAGEVVTYQGPDGTLENWPQDLASQREAIAARLQDTEAQQATDWAALKMQEEELKMEASLHNEAAQLLQTTQAAKTEEAKKSDLSRLQYTPGHEQTAQELAALDAESQSRLAALQEQYQGQPPPEALAALQQDIAQRSQSALAMGDSRRLAAQSAYAGIQQQLQEFQANPEKKGDVGDLWINARKNLAEALQIPEAQAMQLLEDVEAEQDWDKVLGRFQEATPSGEWKSWRNALSDDSDPRQTRVLSNGGIVVNPSITDEAKYKAAVESAKASPEAKAAALARYPEIRQRQGQNVLDTLKEIEGTFGADTLKDWEAYAKKRPQDVSEQDWALKFSEKLKADTAASPWTALLKQVSRSGAQGVYDLRQQSSGFIAGITGSESAMQDAQWAGRKAEAIGATKELEGTVGHNFITRGLLDQLPRLAGSILPAAGGAKLAQGGIKLFAATSLGGRLLPSLSAALKSAATPAQAVKAVQTLTRAGLGGTAAAAGVQTYGSQLADIYGTLRREDPSLTHQQALSAAQQPALLSAAVTALLTTAGGAHGLEKLLVNPAAAKELFKKQFTSQLQRAGFLGAAFAKGAGKELLEELPDELFSQYQAAVASHPKDPQAGTKAIAEFMKQLPELSVAIGVMGGAGEAISDAQGTSVTNGQPSSTTVNLPETQAAAEAAIQNHRHLDANGVEIPEFTAATQQRAALALATARGGDLFDATEKQLNAAGWTRRDSQGRDMPPGKYARLKDYTGPNVLNIDTEGRAHIDPQYLTSLKENLPAVAAAIPEEATSRSAAETDNGTLPEGRRQPAAASKPAPINEPAPNSAPSTAQSGNPAAGQTPAHGAGANANQNPVSAPDQPGTQPPSSGGAAAQSGTPVTAAEESAAPPARSSTAVPTTEQSIADWLVDRHMPDAEAAAAAKAITSHPDMAGKDYDHFTRQITARDSLLKSLGITGSTTKSQSAQNPLRFQGAGPSNSAPVQETTVNDRQPSSTAQPSLPPAVQSALDDTIPGTPSQEVFEAVKKAVQAKEMTEQQATEIVAQQSGALDHTELRQSLENKLGWNTTRANTAAALHFGDKTKSSISLAAAERAASGSGPSTAVGPDPELASAPSTLTQNDDYGRAKLSALSRIKDPAKKAWTRQFLAAFEKSFERHHLLYDAIATGAAARKRLDGQFTAVMSIGGKITRLIDLDAMVGQFSHIESPAAALRATGIEEDVHAMVLQLARKNPGKYGTEALVKQWKALPAKLKQSVWQAYRAANQNTAHANESQMPVLTQEQEWHMMNEFLRMLVQDKHFAGQITESVDASPTLIQWVKDLLKDLGNILRNLLKDAPPALQKDIKSMVAEIGQRLKDIEGKSSTTTARLETIPTLADTQGVTSQALTALLKDGQGILSPDALARIWDQLDPDLQKRVFAQKDRTPRQTTLLKLPYTAATRAPKHELMQELLTLLITDPDAAQSLLSIPKSTNILNNLVSSLRDAIVPPSARPSPAATTSALLATLHAQTLRLLGSITGARFVQSLPPPVTETVTTVTPAVAAKILAARSATSTDSPVPSSENSANSVSRAPARQTATGSPQGEDGNRLVNDGPRSTMTGKPVLTLPAKTIINMESGFKDKLLCDGPTFSLGDACAYNSSFCYVPAMMPKAGYIPNAPKHAAMVVR
ncbi:MAG TPA: hypothetical protein DCP71_15880, partial [Verrucomicrobiales bacterium]|nr:hypothetical protein [Verrucomicrobiales bacterium]